VHLPTRAIVRRPRHSARRRRWCADRRARRGVPLGRPLALLAGRRERRPDRAWSAFAAQAVLPSRQPAQEPELTKH